MTTWQEFGEELEGVEYRSAVAWADPGVTHVRVRHPSVKALSFGGPDLEVIDLRGCPPGMRLQFHAGPALREIHLPSSGPGASLCVSFLGPPTPLQLTGHVAQVDLCWGRPSLDPAEPHGVRHGLGPLRGLHDDSEFDGMWIGTIDAAPAAAAEVIVVLGGSGVPRWTVPAGAKVVVIDGVDDLLEVDLGGNRILRAVELSELPELRSLTGRGHAAFARLDGCRELGSVGCAGRILTVRDADVEELSVLGAWEELDISRSDIRALLASRVDRVRVGECYRIERLVTSPEADVSLYHGVDLSTLEGACGIRLEHVNIAAITGEALGRDPELLDRALGWLESRKGPTECLQAIQLLHAAAVMGQDLPRLWQVRCAIHSNACAKAGHLDDAAVWSWAFPDDLSDRGWEADLRLWRRCMQERALADWPPGHPDPAAYLPTLRLSHEPEHLLAMARAALRARQAGQDVGDLVDLLAAALDEGGRAGRVLGKREPGSVDPRVVGVRAASFDRARGVLQCLVGLREHERGPELVAAFCRWTGRRMPYKQGLDLLGALRDLGAAEATVQLADFAADPSDLERKQHAMALLMRRPGRTLLAAAGKANTGATSPIGEDA